VISFHFRDAFVPKRRNNEIEIDIEEAASNERAAKKVIEPELPKSMQTKSS